MNVDVDQAVTPARGGCALAVEVTPGAKVAGFPAGFNPWRGTVEAKVHAPPEKGEANAELVRLVADFFGVPPSAVAVTAGATSRRKTVTVQGLGPDPARTQLREALGRGQA